MKLAQNYYYIDQNELEVKHGELLGHQIDQHSRYGICIFKEIIEEEAQYHRIEDTLVFDTSEEALVRLEIIKPIIAKADGVAKELNEKLRLARINVIGEPPYKDLKEV